MLLNEFEFVEGFEKVSGSKTDIWVIRQKGTQQKYLMKVFVNLDESGNHPESYHLLKNELKVYQLLTSELIQKNHIRNIVPIRAIETVHAEELIRFVARSSKIPETVIRDNLIVNTLYMLERSDDKKRIDEYQEPNFFNTMFNLGQSLSSTLHLDSIKYSFFITRFIDGSQDIGTYLEDPEFSTDILQVWRCLSIALLTVYHLARIGINQNDLHFGNILLSKASYYGGVDQMDIPMYKKSYLLVFENQTVIVQNEYTPFVFDFDRASILNQHVVTLDDYENVGNCPKFHEKRDLIRFLAELHASFRILIQNFKSMRATQYVEIYSKYLHSIESWVSHPKLRAYVTTLDPYHNSNVSVNRKVLCNDKILDTGVADFPSILKEFFRAAKFPSFPTLSILNGDKTVVTSLLQQLIRDSSWESVPNAKAMADFLHFNIQFVTPTFTEENKKLFTDNIVKFTKV